MSEGRTDGNGQVDGGKDSWMGRVSGVKEVEGATEKDKRTRETLDSVAHLWRAEV